MNEVKISLLVISFPNSLPNDVKWTHNSILLIRRTVKMKKILENKIAVESKQIFMLNIIAYARWMVKCSEQFETDEIRENCKRCSFIFQLEFWISSWIVRITLRHNLLVYWHSCAVDRSNLSCFLVKSICHDCATIKQAPRMMTNFIFITLSCLRRRRAPFVT